MSCLGKGRDYWNRMGTQLTCFNLFIFVSLQTIKTSNPSILKKKEKWKCSQVKRKKLLLREHGTLPSYSGNIHTLTQTYRTSHHVDTEIHILIPRPHLPLRFQSYEQLYDMMLGFFSFFSRVMHIWTSLLCIDLDPAAGFVFFFSFVLVFFLLSFGAWEGWVRAAFTFLVLLLWLFSVFVCFSFIIIITLIVSLASSSSSVVHHPSKDRAAPPVFCLILCRMNFWWLEKSKFSSSSSFVFYLFILCHMASKGSSLPPTSAHFRYNIGKWTATKSFLAIILFWPCAGNPILSQESCVWEWLPPVAPSERYPDPTPSILSHPTHLLLAFLHIHVCLNADGIKRLLLPQSISVFLFYLLLQVEGICGMHSCTGLYRSSVD